MQQKLLERHVFGPFQALSQDEMAAQRAREAKELITDLGPAFVKIVQVL